MYITLVFPLAFTLISSNVSAQKYPIDASVFENSFQKLKDIENSKMMNLAANIRYEYNLWNRARKEYCYDDACNNRILEKMKGLETIKDNFPEFIQQLSWDQVCLQVEINNQFNYIFNERLLGSNGLRNVYVKRDIVPGSHLEMLLVANTTDLYHLKFVLSGEYLAVSLIHRNVHSTPLPTPNTEWRILEVSSDSMRIVFLQNNFLKEYLYVTGDKMGPNYDLLMKTRTGVDEAKFEFITC